MVQVDVRRATDRFVTRASGVESYHSFSFGEHYDPANTHHGVLLAHNEEVLAPGAGFPTHPHRDAEIVTWVLRGALVHDDSTGHSGVVHPGLVQRLSAGSGVRHAERNAGLLGPVRFVQMWVVPDRPGGAPDYAQRDVGPDLRAGELVPVASGRDAPVSAGAVPLSSRHATLHVARMPVGRSVCLPDAPYLHLFVADGAVVVEDVGELGAGDAARLTATGGQRVTAASTTASEILVWEMHATLGEAGR